ncbi:MAG: tyrosine-type recombinase/integrase [Cyanobium sp.]
MLSDKAIQALRPDPSRSGRKHHDRDGLYLWVARSGSKTWRKDYRWQGARQTFTIGSYPKVRLADARKVAMQLNDWLRDGIDPRSQTSRQRREREQPASKPFRDAAEAWLAHHGAAWSPRYRRDMREKLDHFVLPALGDVPIGVLGRAHIEDRLLAPIVARGANEQARRCNDVVRRVLEHAIDLELRADNPATRTRKLIATTRVTHYHRISWVELPELLEVIDRYERERSAERSSLIALRLMMLTLVRPSELREARWGEVDGERRQWIIPAERMKTRVRHIVPLSKQARLLFECQRQITGHTDLVFSTPNHRGTDELPVMSNGCLSMLLRRMGFQGRQTPHGFRGFGQTNCIEQLKVARVVTEKQLAHADGNKVSRAYDWAEYLEERAEMLQRWADLLDEVAVKAGLPPTGDQLMGQQPHLCR